MRFAVCAAAAVAAAFALVSTAAADTVVVTNANPQGWVARNVNFVSGCSGGFSKYAPGGDPQPFGAYYAKLKCPWDVYAQAWIGTNAYTGVRCQDITTLSYSTYTSLRGWGSVAANPDWQWDRQARQPFQLQLSVKWNPTDTKFRHLVFRPWGLTGEARWAFFFEKWQHWDCINGGGIWADELNGAESGTWSYFFDPVTGKYPDAVIVAPCAQGDEYNYDSAYCDTVPPYKTPTGCSLNIAVGARAQNHPTFAYGGGAWWQESNNFEGFFDNVTVGVNSGGTVIETTYDFELDPPLGRPIKVMGITNRDLNRDPRLQSTRYRYKYAVWGKKMPWVDYYAALTGYYKQFQENEGYPITDGSMWDNLTTTEFDMSLVPVQVLTGLPYQDGEYLRATGFIAKVVTAGPWPPPPYTGSLFHPFYFVPDSTDVEYVGP